MGSWMEAIGYKVFYFNEKNLPDNVAGRIEYDEKWICLNVCYTKAALFTMIHEIIHLCIHTIVGEKKFGRRVQKTYDYIWKWGRR